MTEPLAKFDDLSVSFRVQERVVPAVRHLNLSIQPGEVVALVGESGSGKSVTAMSLLRLVPAPPAIYAGSIYWRGRDVLAMKDSELRKIRGNEIGMIFQEPMTALNPTWTCGDQVGEALRLHTPLMPDEIDSRVLALFGEVGIPEPKQRMRQYPHELSGGMRQRVCIAMALACNPKLLIADEPTTALDVTIQAQILDLLKRLQRDKGMAVLFITHDLGIVAEFADRVVMMRNGENVEEGAVADVFADPKHPYTKGLLACRPKFGSRGTQLPTVEDFVQTWCPLPPRKTDEAGS